MSTTKKMKHRTIFCTAIQYLNLLMKKGIGTCVPGAVFERSRLKWPRNWPRSRSRTQHRDGIGIGIGIAMTPPPKGSRFALRVRTRMKEMCIRYLKPGHNWYQCKARTPSFQRGRLAEYDGATRRPGSVITTPSQGSGVRHADCYLSRRPGR